MLHLLRNGTLTLDARLPDSSNASFCATVRGPDAAIPCVYKPIAGERPLRDFPDGTLAYREVAAWLVSEATPWGVVPPTVLRDGPYGEGAVQLWIDVDEAVDVVELVSAGDARLRAIALFDAVVNNTDRKGSHLLVTPSGHVYGVDHGITFSAEPKLRTVLWGWRGQPFSADEALALDALRRDLARGLGRDLRRLLDRSEVDATAARVAGLLAAGTFPFPNPDWPAVPWPPF